MVTHWHEALELPKYDKLCVIKVVNLKNNKIDYNMARFRKNWVYKTGKIVSDQILSWAYINEL